VGRWVRDGGWREKRKIREGNKGERARARANAGARARARARKEESEGRKGGKGDAAYMARSSPRRPLMSSTSDDTAADDGGPCPSPLHTVDICAQNRQEQ
jgi:hypothetical protein